MAALLIKEAVFNYVCIKSPKLEFEKKADPKGEHINKEYIVDVLMPQASWKKFKKHYKSVSAIEKAKSFTAKEYEEAFKVAPPTDEKYQDEDGDFTVIKFRQRAYYTSNGDATKSPQVVGAVTLRNGNGDVVGHEDAKGLTVGVDVEIGNGSVGMLQFRERTWTYGGKAGLSLDLLAIMVSDLVEYTSSTDALAFDTEDKEVGDDDNPFAGESIVSGNDGGGSSTPKKGDDEDEDATGW